MSAPFVIKVGGELFQFPEKRAELARMLSTLRAQGLGVVLVHGGGPQISAMCERLGISPRFVRGRRVTDTETMQVALSVLLGSINAPFVGELVRAGVSAVGCHGGDDALFGVETEDPELGLVGRVTSVRPELVTLLVSRGVVPVIAPIGVSLDGTLMNVNADIAAGALAGALRAQRIVAVTNVKGLYREFGREESFVSRISFDEVQQMIARGEISDGMLPKLEGLLEALHRGAQCAQIIDGREAHTLGERILASEPCGTIIER